MSDKVIIKTVGELSARVGTEVAFDGWITVTQDRINKFDALTLVRADARTRE